MQGYTEKQSQKKKKGKWYGAHVLLFLYEMAWGKGTERKSSKKYTLN